MNALSLGHNLAEMVSVQAYLCSETTPLTWVGGASLEYVQDDAQVEKSHKYDPTQDSDNGANLVVNHK